jgi:2-polyprenyl-3-methyl-5-hydroxy-6-metoxy-1,4-benzoquinol methylase
MTDSYVEWKAWHFEDFGRFDAKAAIYYRRELHASGVSSVRGLTVGELGYGNGAFAGWVRHSGGHWVGREAIPELHQRAVDAGFEVVTPDVEFSHVCGPGALDVIVAFDVIEHLEIGAIRSFLHETREALRPGGLVLLRLPSGDSPFSHAIYRGDLTHRSALGSSAVRQLAEEVGLDVKQIRSPVLPVTGLGMLRGVRRTCVLLVQFIVFRFVGTVLMANSGAVVSPNMFVVFRRPER